MVGVEDVQQEVDVERHGTLGRLVLVLVYINKKLCTSVQNIGNEHLVLLYFLVYIIYGMNVVERERKKMTEFGCERETEMKREREREGRIKRREVNPTHDCD